MRTRAEAVAFLKASGFDASERDWALGRTIVVPADPHPPDGTGIVVYERVAYLVPNENDWEVHEFHIVPSRVTPARSLAEACHVAIAILRRSSDDER
jgi:hypothetical protein